MAATGALLSDLVGRERECGVIDDIVVKAMAGEGGALVVRGEAGIGKTALLERAAQQSSGTLVLYATGVEAESDLAFAGLHGLVRPVVEKLESLPAVQRGALAGALGLGPSTDADRLLVSAALLGLLAAAAEDQAVLCVVDDAQWLDRPSRDALMFAARRLRGEQLAMLFGVRDGEPQRFEAPGLPELRLNGLDVASAQVLVSRRAGEASASVRERLVTEAAGNPLALLELPAGLSGGQLAGDETLPDAIPLTPRLQAVFRQRIERLPDPTQAALRIAAAEDTGDAATIVRAVAQAGLPPSALDPAERQDLIRAAGARVTFRHPLVRSALWEGATLNERHLAHAALAGALAGEENADRRVWHQAMATLNPDEEVAAALEASARRAQARAAHASAASALRRAAELSTDEHRRTLRLAGAAAAAWDAGQPDAARPSLARVLPAATGELRAKLLQLNGSIEASCGSLTVALPQLVEGAAVTADASLRLELLVDAAEVAAFSGQLAIAVELAQRAVDLEPRTQHDRMMYALLIGFSKVFSGDPQGARPLLDDVIREADDLEDDPRALVLAGSASSVRGHSGDGVAYTARAVASARRQGLLNQLARALEAHSWELINNSSFDSAYAAATEGYELSLDVGHREGWHLANMAAVEAALGREADARGHTADVLAIGQRSGATFLTGVATWTLGFLELAVGRPEQASHHMLALTDLGGADVNPLVALPAIPDAVEAAVRSGRVDELGHRMAAFEFWTESTDVEARRALLARCQALLATRPPDEAFGEAIARSDVLPPLERARTELLYGEWLRRERRRQEARVHLRAALELFASLGTRPFIERAEAELRATGETARKRDPSTLDDLTPHEIQIAGLVAEGLTNKEIAAQLYLSPRTIDYHLRKVFSKLGIGSRTELVRHGLPTRG